MSVNNNTPTFIVNIIMLIAGFILGIFVPYFKSLVYRKDSEFCRYATPLEKIPRERQLIVTKIFNRTRIINCYWFENREVTTIDNVTYKHCVYGKKFLTPNGRGASQCPFDKQYF